VPDLAFSLLPWPCAKYLERERRGGGGGRGEGIEGRGGGDVRREYRVCGSLISTSARIGGGARSRVSHVLKSSRGHAQPLSPQPLPPPAAVLQPPGISWGVLHGVLNGGTTCQHKPTHASATAAHDCSWGCITPSPAPEADHWQRERCSNATATPQQGHSKATARPQQGHSEATARPQRPAA
jgi:hypothetical protein